MSPREPDPPEPTVPDDPPETPTVESLHERIAHLEHAIGFANHSAVVPAWRRRTPGEKRWPMGVAIVALVGLQLLIPNELSPQWGYVLPTIEVLLLLVLVVLEPGSRIEHTQRPVRELGLALVAVASVANGYSAVRLVLALVQGTDLGSAGELLATGGAIYLTNVLVFTLWYWELDRGGPAARASGTEQRVDFLFPQMTTPRLDPHWEPTIVDYFYVSFTNSTAFSPTDTMPMTRWAKMIMLLQSAISLVVVVLVIARAVNTLQ